MISASKQKVSSRWLVLSAVVLLLIAGGLWWDKQATEPERAFNAMLSQSLKTTAVTTQTSQTGNGTSAKQWSQFSLGAQNISHSLTVLQQTGTTVTDEMIGTTTTDYTRYASIVTDQKGKDGKPLNLSKVLGVWASSKNDSEGGTLLSQSILGTTLPLGGMVVPIGSVSPENRAKLLTEIEQNKVYQVSYKDVQRKTVAGRLQYTYNVTIEPEKYVRLIKDFAISLGLHDLDKIDPANYKDQSPLKVQLTVDVRARHLSKATLTEGGYSQDYTAYDVPVHVTVPTQTITTAELQKRLTEIQ